MENIRRIPVNRFCKWTILLIIFISVPATVNAQRLDFGFTYDFVGFNPTRFNNQIFFSETSYKAYYIKQFQCPWGVQNNMSFNAVADYNRFFVKVSFGLNSNLIYGMRYNYKYPIGENSFKTYYSRIAFSQTDISGSFGLVVSSRGFMRPYIEAGLGRCMNPTYREDMATEKSFESFWSDRTELRNYTELDKPFNYLLIGYGYRGDLFTISARYKIRLGHHDVYYSNLSLGMSIYTKFSKLRKHYIYQPED